MSQRNPMNERYQSNKPEGKTRKSAASAKPVTKAASSVRPEPTTPPKKGFLERMTSGSTDEEKAKSSKGKTNARTERKTERQRRRAIQSFVPDTAEFKRLNRKRFIYSAVGFAGMIIAIIVSLFMPEQMALSIGIMIVAWVFFFIGVRIDSNQLRPLRQKGYEQARRQAEKKEKKGKKH